MTTCINLGIGRSDQDCPRSGLNYDGLEAINNVPGKTLWFNRRMNEKICFSSHQLEGLSKSSLNTSTSLELQT